MSSVAHAKSVIFEIPVLPRHGVRESVEGFRLLTGEGNRLLTGAVEQVIPDLSLVLLIDEPLVECDEFHAGVIVIDGEIRENSD